MKTLPPGRYAIVATVGRAAAEAAVLAFVLVGEDRGVTPGRLGILAACTSAPQVVTAPWLGGRLDRARHPARVLAALVAGLAAGIVVIGLALGRWWFPLVAALALGWSVGEPAVMGGLSGLASRSGAGDGRLETADAASYGAATIAGQGVVAGLALVSGADATVVALAVLAGVAALALARLPLVGAGAGAPGEVAPPWRLGLRTLGRDPALRSVTVLTTVSMSAFGGLALAALGVAEHHGRSSAAGAGLVLALGVGAVLGAWSARRLGATARPVAGAFVSVAVVAVGFALALGPWWSVVAGFALAGFADGPLLAATFAVRTARTPLGLRASVYTIAASLKIAASALGAVIVGMVVGARPRAGVVVLAVVQVLALAAGLAAARRPTR